MQKKASRAVGIVNLSERQYEFAERYYKDESFRARIGAANPEETLSLLGIDQPENMETRIVENTEDTVYFVFPSDPNVQLSDESLSTVTGGSTAGSIATLTTFGSFPSCLGSAGTASTLSSAES